MLSIFDDLFIILQYNLLMKISKNLYKFLSNPVFIICSLVITALADLAIYNIRIVGHGSYKTTNLICIGLVFLSLIDVILAYRHKDADLKTLIKETVPALIFFIGFLVGKFFLRG